MKCTRLIAIAMAALMAISPIAEARGGSSGGGHSGFGGGHSSFGGGRSTPTLAPSAARTSGFGSGASKSTPFIAAPSPAKSTATGKALYAANANKAAVAAYNAPKSTPAPAVAAAQAAPAAPYHYTPPAPTNYNGGGYVARSPAPVHIHNNTTYVSHDNGGGMSGFWWYMLGRESAPRHDTVIVQQPGTTVIQQAPAGYAGAPGSVNGVAPAGSVAAAPGTTVPQAQAAQAAQGNAEEGHHGFLWGLLRVLVWLALIGGLIFLVSKLWSAWTARKVRFAHKNNYTL